MGPLRDTIRAVAMPIDVAALPGPAQKILDPTGPAPLKALAAKGAAPGLRPGDLLAIVVGLAASDGPHAATAQATLAKLPAPIVGGAFAGPLQPAVLDALAPLYADDPGVAERIVNHPDVAVETIVALAAVASEPVCELVATNEERLLAAPAIIERLYLNKRCRMSTADRILELAVRHGIELAIPAFAQAKQAIAGELIAEPTEEPTFDDQQFAEASTEAEKLQLADGEDTHVVDEETGKEEVAEKAKPLHAIWADMRPPAKIRLLTIGTVKQYNKKGEVVDETRFDPKALRMIGVRDSNPLVATAALDTPGVNEGEIERIAKMRNICEEVLGLIGRSKEWTRHYPIKKALVMNPRCPFGHASKWIMHLYESDLKAIAKSKDVSGAVQTAAKQQLQRKGK